MNKAESLQRQRAELQQKSRPRFGTQESSVQNLTESLSNILMQVPAEKWNWDSFFDFSMGLQSQARTWVTSVSYPRQTQAAPHPPPADQGTGFLAIPDYVSNIKKIISLYAFSFDVSVSETRLYYFIQILGREY